MVEEFDARHSLRGDFGAATKTHSHRYRVELVVRGERLRPDGTLCDIGRLTATLRQAVADLDNRDLDNLAQFAATNSTAEVVAEQLASRVRTGVNGDDLATLTIRVWESAKAFGAFSVSWV